MNSRMEKYYDNEPSVMSSREQRNEKLYNNIGNYEVTNYKLDSNVAVLDEDVHDIDVGQIKKILDTRYNKMPKRRSIVVEESDEVVDIKLDDTREYDINAILERARSEKEVDYEKERVKKLRDTQFDILKSLDFNEDSELEETTQKSEDNKELMNLINTITTNELLTKTVTPKKAEEELDPLDILTDLKGSENTVIIPGFQENEESNEINPIMSLKEAQNRKSSLEESRDLSNTLTFTQSDFDDFNDLKKEVKSSRSLIYVISAIICVAIVVGGFFLFKYFFKV